MKINWSQIPGYREDMTAEEKLTLLDEYEGVLGDNAPPTGVKVIAKSQFDKVASELATAKKQLRDKMTEDEQREIDRLAAEESLKQEVETLRKEKTLTEYKASYLAQGYDNDLAESTAAALSDGNMEVVFTNMKTHAANLEKNLRAQILKETPKPPAGIVDDKEGSGSLYAKTLAENAVATNTVSQKALNHYIGGKEE